jgi:hypothetical protein
MTHADWWARVVHARTDRADLAAVRHLRQRAEAIELRLEIQSG